MAPALDSLPARLGLALYRAGGMVATPFLHWHLRRRCAKGREDASRLQERYGQASQPRPRGPLVWIHASSIGESVSTLALIDALRDRYEGLAILLTTGTVSSAKMMAERLPDGVPHQFVPLDIAPAVRRFYDHWQPDMGLFVESELWPNLIVEAASRSIPLAVINARMSKGSFRRWGRAAAFTRALLGCFDRIVAQSEKDRARFQSLGASHSSCHGNLKFASAPLKADAQALAIVEQQMGQRPRWLAASTHPGEEVLIAQCHRTMAADWPDLVTLLVPRHPERGAEIEAQLRDLGMTVRRRSAGEPIDADCQIYLADSLGELGLWYRAAEITFVGGTLVPIGGHNPLEPAKLNCAVLFGPYSHNCQLIADEMIAAEGLRQFEDADQLAACVSGLLRDQSACHRLAEAGMHYANTKNQVLEKVMEELSPLLERVAQPRQRTLVS